MGQRAVYSHSDPHLAIGASTAVFAPGGRAVGRRISDRALTANTRETTLGGDAERVAARIAGDATILACEPAFAAAALSNALALRRAGVHFSLSIHVEDARVRAIRERSLELCATYATWDEVRIALDQFAATVTPKPALPSDERGFLLEAARLADSILVRSWTEHARLVAAVGTVRRDVEIVVNEDPEVPTGIAGERTDVVVYAPHCRADELAPFVTALGDLEVPVTVVARDRPTIPSRVRFELPERAAEALGRARVIVDATDNDPGVALALAKLGRPLVIPSTGGAIEILRGTYTYDAWHRRGILAATVSALASLAPAIREQQWEDRPRDRARPVFGADAPTVSVIVATYNRPERLAATLAAIERQTYPAVEVIVVNDGGTDVHDVVAGFSRARLIDQPENRGPAAARNRGLAEAHGTYVIFFDDDDEMFPDHLAALVNALERSGLEVAYGQLINCFVGSAARDRSADTLAGHAALLDHADIQWAGALATTAVMFRHALVNRIGLLDESLGIAEDYEFWLRLAGGREWARVSDVTSIYFIRNDGSHFSSNDGARRYLQAHEAIYAKNPSARPLVRAGRASMLEFFGQGSAGRNGLPAA